LLLQASKGNKPHGRRQCPYCTCSRESRACRSAPLSATFRYGHYRDWTVRQHVHRFGARPRLGEGGDLGPCPRARAPRLLVRVRSWWWLRPLSWITRGRWTRRAMRTSQVGWHHAKGHLGGRRQLFSSVRISSGATSVALVVGKAGWGRRRRLKREGRSDGGNVGGSTSRVRWRSRSSGREAR
jgi:hypothetical protein